MKIGVAYVAYLSGETLLELAVQSLESISSEEHELVFSGWLNKPIPESWRRQLEPFGPVYDNDENCLARGWNRGINDLLDQGCDYVFVPNVDIEVRDDSLDNLVRAAEAKPDYLLWTMSTWADRASLDRAVLDDHWMPYPDFSAFMIDRRCWDLVGEFDENFKPAYDEDLDYHWRIHLTGFEAGHYEGSRFYHVGSATINLDAALRSANRTTHAANDAYFIRKWGMKPVACCDQPTEGMYRTPFNR